MKKILFFLCLMILMIACQKEVSDVQAGYFIRFFGDALDDFGSKVDLTSDGGYVIAGTTQRTVSNSDIILITTDKYGFQNSETVYYGGEEDEKCTGLLVLDDGYVLTGSVTDSAGVENVILMKFGVDGIQEWTTSWNSAGQGIDLALINNQIVVAGYRLTTEGQKRPMICTFDLIGNKLNLDTPTDNPGDYFTSLGNRNNQIFGFGTSLKNASNTDMFIKGTSTDITTFVLSGNETSSRIISSSDGGFFIIGTTDPIGAGSNQIVVKKLNNDFSEDLSFITNPIGSNAYYRGVDIQQMEDGSLVVLGDKTLSKDTDIVIFILNPDGSIRTSKIYGKTGNQSASSLKRTPDGGMIILGSNQQEKTSSMITLIKTDREGNIWE